GCRVRGRGEGDAPGGGARGALRSAPPAEGGGGAFPADANAIDTSRNIGKPRMRTHCDGAGAPGLACDVPTTGSRVPPWTLQPIRARVHQAYGADVLERGHTHATDRHFPARSCPRLRADGVGPARQSA